MKVHFIAIGGSAMHNLAIALSKKGVEVTGSDDEIFDPARSRLAACGLLPEKEGWYPERIGKEIDAVVLGMHARADNPELLKAKELGLRIYSYPEYLYEQSNNKLRIVVGGSHGKTTTTAMILHVLRHCGVEADYMVGAQLKGFDVMVRLSTTAHVMVIEGDEYLTSAIDPRPKFHLYRPNVAIITGIEWDHVNVFPTFEVYRSQFARFAELIEPGGQLIYCAEDAEVCRVAESCQRTDIEKHPYSCPTHSVAAGTTYLGEGAAAVPLRIFGHHNLLNLAAARMACEAVGVTEQQFADAISTFEGASKRLELVGANDRTAVYKDFAHAPSKLRATIAAMREQYPQRKLVACMELHTYSSLTQQFLQQYAHTMDKADVGMVYFSHHALQLKHLPPLEPSEVQQEFGGGVQVFTSSAAMVSAIEALPWGEAKEGMNLLMMSSGNFDGIDFAQLADTIMNKQKA